MEQRNGMLLFACIWSFVLVWFSPAMIGGEYRQLQSRNWTAEENGQVVSCEKKSGFVEIRVRYVVDGNAYETNRLRFASITSDPWAKEFVRQHPANSQITVYYDPRNPAEAVILQGLRGFDYTVMLFVSPFVLIGVMLWVMVLRTRRKRSGFAGLQIEQDASHVRLRPDAVYIF